MILKKNFFFNTIKISPKTIKRNFIITKKAFDKIKIEYLRSEIPLLSSYEKNYDFNFSQKLIRKFSKYENIVLIGMGGSVLGSKSIYSYFRNKIKKKVFFFDNLDINLYLKYKKIKNINNSCFIIISKSGATLEVISNFFLIFSKTLLKNKLIFITENKNSVLTNLANKYNAELIEHKKFIPGRYSVLSEVGMLPAALMGLNIENFKNLKKLINDKNFISSLLYNVTCIYSLHKKGIKNSVLLSYASNLNDLCFWYQQLTAESLGKKGKGITPIISFGPKDQHSMLQLFLDGPKDKFFTFFTFEKNIKKKIFITKNFSNTINFLGNKSINKIIKCQSEAIQNIFTKQNIPFRKIVFKKNNENELGNFFTFSVLETILLSRLIKVDPFSQPAVECAKKEAKKLILRQ